MGEDKCKENKGISVKKWLASISIIFFIFNAWKFMTTPGSEIPILSMLFNMIIYLSIIIFLLHKNEITFDEYRYIQTKIDKYFHKSTSD